MKFKSQIFTAVSGSVGGLTFAKNKGGLYTRARAIPTNPNTPAQVAARDALSTLVDAWTNILAESQRDAWRTYAANTPVVDVFGDPKLLTGQQMYLRSNQPRVRAGVPRVDPGPTIFNLGTFTTISIAISAAAPNDIIVTFTTGDAWANVDGGFLFIGASRQQNQSISFFKGPFRQAGTIFGDPVPPTSPKTIVSDFPYALANKAFVTARAGQADGRLSTAQIVSTVVVP